jgi:hypothetical protein
MKIYNRRDMAMKLRNGSINVFGDHVVISINDPDPDDDLNGLLAEVADFIDTGGNAHTFFFNDIRSLDQVGVPPTMQDIIRLDNIYRSNSTKEFVLHCHMGISRSTAMGIIIQFLRSGSTYGAINEIMTLIPEARPNPLIIKLADEFYGLTGDDRLYTNLIDYMRHGPTEEEIHESINFATTNTGFDPNQQHDEIDVDETKLQPIVDYACDMVEENLAGDQITYIGITIDGVAKDIAIQSFVDMGIVSPDDDELKYVTDKIKDEMSLHDLTVDFQSSRPINNIYRALRPLDLRF